MYDSDLSNKEWAIIEYHFNPKDQRGNAHKHPKKLIVDAILYVVKGGITWRLLPNDFPPWKTVYSHFSRWNKNGTWTAVLNKLTRFIVKKRGVNPCLVMVLLTHKALKLNMIANNAASMAIKK